MKLLPFLIQLSLLLSFSYLFADNTKLITPQQLWEGYDPDQGDFKEEILHEGIQDGVYTKETYISAYVLDEEIRIYCIYKVKEGLKKAPALLQVHGWMGRPNIRSTDPYLADGWAVMAHDYCGKSGNRKYTTKYPKSLEHGNMEKRIRTKLKNGDFVDNPKQISDYLWYAMQRRVLSYLEQQKEVDPHKMGATGYSYGGTLMWHLGTDPRIKAFVAYFGIGWNTYYRDKQVMMYKIPYHEPAMNKGEKINLASIAPQSYVPSINAAPLFLNGTNDHHGGFERGLETFKLLKPSIPWSYTLQARGHHNTDKIGHIAKPWLEKHVLDKDHFWPEPSESSIQLNSEGIPTFKVSPSTLNRVKKVQMYYALKSPVSYARTWRDIDCIKEGSSFIGIMPVLNIDDYVFGYANITYDNDIVRSTKFNAEIPSKLGEAIATDKKSNSLSSENSASAWSQAVETEGVGSVKGFRCINKHRGTLNEQLHDEKWKAPKGAKLQFKFYCTEPQEIIFTSGRYSSILKITASDDWQTMTLASNKLVHQNNKKHLSDWSVATDLGIKSNSGYDVTKIVFADFKWDAQE